MKLLLGEGNIDIYKYVCVCVCVCVEGGLWVSGYIGEMENTRNSCRIYAKKIYL